jgi:hypothetical protein
VSLVEWSLPVNPALGTLRQKDVEFETSLGYIVSSRPDWAIEQNPDQKKSIISMMYTQHSVRLSS